MPPRQPPPALLAPLLLLCTLLPPSASNLTTRQQAPLCGSFCRFSMCSANATLQPLRPAPFVILGPPLLPSNRFVCHPDPSNPSNPTPLITILATGDPQLALSPPTTFTPLSLWRPPTLSPTFPPNFLRIAQTSPGRRRLPGITNAPPRGNQWSFLHNRCFILPIHRYRPLTSPSQPRPPTIDSTTQPDACVAFRTRAPSLHVQLTWQSNGDGDLVVQQPSGAVVDFLNPASPAGGRLVGDNGVDTCAHPDFPGYTENVVYFPGRPVPAGRWVAEAWQAAECGRRRATTRWNLTVVRDGVVRTTTRGLARYAGQYQRVGVLPFTV